MKKWEKIKILAEIIATLQESTAHGKLSRQVVRVTTIDLAKLRQYNTDKFPPLGDTQELAYTDCDTPKDLAEVLLWKLGKWKVYKKFASNYVAKSPSATTTDVVFFALVEHLKDKQKPIYDQHSVRALWAITDDWWGVEVARYKALLFDGKNKWRGTAGGDQSVECYEDFKRKIGVLSEGANEDDLRALDRLLMPLGQAIKSLTRNYSDFRELCGKAP